jgi:hypothetical protein
MINSYDIHFVDFNKKQQLNIKGQIGSFICNSRVAGEEANKLLKEINFSPISHGTMTHVASLQKLS